MSHVGALYEMPLALCLFVLFMSGAGGYGFCVWGWSNIYNNRIGRGAALIGVGFMFGLSGLCLFALAPSEWAIAQ